MDSLEAIVPIDGRYREKVYFLEKYFSENAIMKERIRIELNYLVKFMDEVESSKIKLLPRNWRDSIKEIIDNFSLDEAKKIKEIEKTVGHDVVAVVRFLIDKLREAGLEILTPYVHIGLTSEDVNNIAYSVLLKRFNEEVLIPLILKIVDKLYSMSSDNMETVMLARTHGVPAVPTTFGRFIANYAYRVARILEELASIKFPGKIGGAVGDHNALKFSYPEIDWIKFSRSFVESQGLRYFPAFTQILPHDQLSEYLMKIALLDSILSNLCRDMWMMSLLGYLYFPPLKDEVHSSTMPHKSNPTLIENSEGAFDLASEILTYISRRLLSSRLHRDLSDSIIKRFYGLPLSLTCIGIQNLLVSLDRVEVDREAMVKDIEQHQEVLSEAYQVYLRKHGYVEAYEVIRAITREHPQEILKKLEGRIPDRELEHLSQLSPSKYIGEAIEITEKLLREVEEIMKKFTEK
ncbi:MAG: lyase family protein [Aigarchaeota archaeon]|nr:lyase family protein [Aigarchaeota archaeon]MCX8193112.1 lyase family protein [Nitrososphaeria archaeon]MDW7986735.1 lyase family protein [Nitrososphaerota archaeon]